MQLQPTTSEEPFTSGCLALIEGVTQTIVEALQPPPILTLSQWADEFAHLSPETSAKGGKFKSFGYQDGIMDAITDPAVTTVSVMKSARVGYTKILDHVVGYYIHQDPCPVMVVQPRVEDAEDYSRTEIAPMLRDTPVLAAIAGDLKAKDSNQRVAKRAFRNGSSVAFIGANSPGGFRRITARVACFDEVDGYPPQGAGDEGDQIALGTKRTETFWNRKIILGSTPTVRGISRIEKALADSDERYYFVPCPHCGAKQTIKWQNIRWDKDEATGEHLPETAYLVCEAAGCVITEDHKEWMIDPVRAEWIASRPMKNGHAGFRIWAGYSLFPNARWRFIVAEFLRVHKDPHQLKTFTNLVLGETWEEDAETVDGHELLARCADDFAHPKPAPSGVLAVTCGVDTQDDRIEVERVGWGVDEVSFSLDHSIFYGDPSAPDLWKQLDEYLLTPTKFADGREIPVHATCIDSGGHHTAAVYRFVKDRFRRRVYAIKGHSTPGHPVWPKRASKNNKGKINLFMIGTDSAKDAIYARLRVKEPGPGYCHFPAGREPHYFEQLTAEKVVTRYHKGFPRREYVKAEKDRNEALDCRVYAYAALVSLNIRWGSLQAEKQAAVAANKPAPAQDSAEPDAIDEPTPQAPPPARFAPKRQGGWLAGNRPRSGGWL